MAKKLPLSQAIAPLYGIDNAKMNAFRQKRAFSRGLMFRLCQIIRSIFINHHFSEGLFGGQFTA